MVKPCIVSGLNKDTIKKLRSFAQNKKCDDNCNLVEVMCCDGGCITGNATINNPKIAKNLLNELLNKSNDIEKL